MTSPHESATAKRYQRQRLSLGLLGTFVGWGYLLVLVGTPLGRTLGDAVAGAGGPYAQFLVFVILVGLIAQIYGLPLSYIQGYWLEHRYGLSNQTFGAWVWESLKGLLVGAVIGIPMLLIFYYGLRTFGAGWWLPVGIVMFLLGVVLGRLAPVLIFPLFYRFEPLAADTGLTAGIKELSDRAGLSIEGIYRFDMSKNTRKANAAFTGLGRAKRVLLADTLLDEFGEEEILAVVAHELGHFKLRHIWSGMALGTLLTFGGLYLVARLHAGLAAGDITALATLPWLALLLSVYGFVTGPLTNFISRRHEFAADRYAMEMMGEGRPLAAALDRLADLNLGDRDPHPAVEFLFHSHPSITRRMAALAT